MPSRTIPRPILLAALLACAAALSACGGSGSSATAAPSAAAPSAAAPSVAASAPASEAPAAGGGDAVTIQNFAFGPATLSVAVGSTVTWTNADSAAHTVTADDGSFDSKSIAAGSTFSQTFDTAGTFAYHCSIHPNMTASVDVK
jgi:plastocyanin